MALGSRKKETKFKAVYGNFNINMEPVALTDVTNDLKGYVSEDIISIPAKLNFNKQFGNFNNFKGLRNYLQIIVDERTFNIYEDSYIRNVDINLADKIRHIKVVYFLYINPNSNWRGIISGQLLQLKSYGILSEADLYIHISDCFNLYSVVEKLIREIIPSAILSCNYENLYEYPGIKLIFDLARQYPDDNFIYFHAKGISQNIHSRSVDEVTLFEETFKSWRKNVQFLNHEGIQKIGLFPAVLPEKNSQPGDVGGWIWYNYWYATGRYLSNCPEPLLNKNRYYYEGWLAMQHSENQFITNDCMSLYKIRAVSKNYFTPTEADYHLNLIPKQPFKLSKRIIQVLGSSFFAHRYFQIMRLTSVFKITKH